MRYQRPAFGPQSLAECLCCCRVTACRALCYGQPYLDAGIAQRLQRGPDVGLQLVLHARQAQQLHLHLQALNHGGHLQRAVMYAQLGLDVARLGNGEGEATARWAAPPWGQLGL